MARAVEQALVGGTLSDRAYERLKHEILQGDLAPGARLGVRQLSDGYEIGVIPIREALQRLAGEGLVTAVGQRGFRVPLISLTDLLDVTRTRAMIESEAMRLSMRNGDDAWEANVVAAYHQLCKIEQAQGPVLDFPEWDRRNLAFHEALIAACQSSWLHRLRRTLHDQHRRYRYLSVHYSLDRRLVDEHTALYEAVLSRDEDAAAEILTSHIGHTATAVAKILQSQGENAGGSSA